jgi:hypothetical protein
MGKNFHPGEREMNGYGEAVERLLAKQARQCTDNVTLWCVRVTIVPVKKKKNCYIF